MTLARAICAVANERASSIVTIRKPGPQQRVSLTAWRRQDLAAREVVLPAGVFVHFVRFTLAAERKSLVFPRYGWFSGIWSVLVTERERKRCLEPLL